MKCVQCSVLSCNLVVVVDVAVTVVVVVVVVIIEGSLEVKLPTIWTDGKTEVGRVKQKSRSEKIREEKKREERRCRSTKR